MTMFKQVADIQTADMLNLPVPSLKGGKPIDVIVEPSEQILEKIKEFAERAEACRGGSVDPSDDNMLKITHEGRLLGLDQRLINPEWPDNPSSKVNECVSNVYRIWNDTAGKRLTQLVFSDLSTPKGGSEFNVYSDIRSKLIAKGVPAEEIAFIHDAKTDTQKDTLFAKMRAGSVRILLGSTAKMGAGTNVQTKLVALHHLDVPWRPSDIEQREGRILRQGNSNSEVSIYRYATRGTFDAYTWGLIESKQKFISQIMTSKSPARSCEDIDEAVLSYAEIKALATGDPLVKEKIDLEVQVSKLQILKAEYQRQANQMQDDLQVNMPKLKKHCLEGIENAKKSIDILANHMADKNNFKMKVGKTTYTEKKLAGKAIMDLCNKETIEPVEIGTYCGFALTLHYNTWNLAFVATLCGGLPLTVELGSDALGNITRIDNALESLPERLNAFKEKLSTVEKDMALTKVELQKPFEQEQELLDKTQRLQAVDVLLQADTGIDLVGGEDKGTIVEAEATQKATPRAVAAEPIIER